METGIRDRTLLRAGSRSKTSDLRHISSAVTSSIQRNSEFSSGQGISYGNWPFTYGGTDGTEVRFLGVKFQIKGQTHYGWIRLAVGVGRKAVPGAVLGYAYETIANKRLSAGNSSMSSNEAQNNDAQNVKDIQKTGHPFDRDARVGR